MAAKNTLTLATAPPAKPDTRTTEEKVHAEIQTLAQARFIASASIDAAVALMQDRLPNRNPGAAQLKAKGRVLLVDVHDELLTRVAEGESVFTICHDAHMPCRAVVYKWLRSDTTFQNEYESAMLQRADKYVEQIAELSRHLTARAQMGASNEEVTALKSHINTLQWIAARLNPKKYGDKQMLDIDQKVSMDEGQLDKRLALLLAKGAQRVLS